MDIFKNICLEHNDICPHLKCCCEKCNMERRQNYNKTIECYEVLKVVELVSPVIDELKQEIEKLKGRISALE